MTLNTKTGGPTRYIKDKVVIFLTKDHARCIYKKVESESIINTDTIKQEIEADKLNNNYNLEEDDINPYHEIITSKVEKENTMISQMEQWSILSNVVNYVQYNTLEIFMIQILERKRKDIY